MAKKASRSRPPPREWWEPLAQEATKLLAKAAVHIFDRWWNDDKPTRRVSGKAAPGRESTTAKPRKPRTPPAWWKTLCVPPTASPAEIKTSYRKLMSETHPDKVAHLSEKLQKAASREARKLNAALEAALKGRS